MNEGIKRRRPKKFVFYETEDNYARFRTKLIYEGIKQTTFFRELVLSFLQDIKHFRAWIEENPKCKVKKHTVKVKRLEDKRIERERKAFNFDGIDVDEIFDIIADEDKDE